MQGRYSRDKRIIFAGAIFEQDSVNALRKHCTLYFHGHSVGGTNPSLLEAMASGALVAAHDNEFNRAILNEDAFYFSTADEVTDLISTNKQPEKAAGMICNNLKKIKEQFNWPAIVDAYEAVMIECHKAKR